MQEKMAMDAKDFVTLPGQEQVWNMAPGRTAALKLLNGQTGESVMAFEEVAPAGTETPLHLHHGSDEVMFVLSGEFSFKIGDQLTTGGPGTCVFMPREIPHAWKNSGAEPGRAFFMYVPGTAGKVFEEMRRLNRPVASMNEAHVAEMFQRCGWEIVGPPPF
jgi:mannose-6-phosphate isomerase-like protein (cupin superfamily)